MHEILRELIKYCEVFYYVLEKSMDAATGIGGMHLICLLLAAEAHTDPNISKESIRGECMLILLDTSSNITQKYGTTFLL